MKNLLLITMLNLATVLLAEDTTSYYATRMISFAPAPGQFMSEVWAQPGIDYALGENGTGVSLGGFGGSIVLGFDRPIVNHPQNPYGVDFLVNSNAFSGSEYGVWSEPAAVQVMQDKNKNGLPDDGEWYELAGSDYYLSTTLHNVEMTYYNPKHDGRATIPWSTNYGVKGAMITNQFHEHSFYPADAGFDCNYDSMTVTGNMIMGCINLSKPSYVESHRPQLFGYADNRGFSNMDINNVVNPYDYSKNVQDGFDLNWAVDKDGNHVALDSVHFVRIYTAINQDGGWLGELSSEILGVGIVKPDPNYIPQDYYNNYIGLTQLKAVVGHPIQYEGLVFKNGIPVNEGNPQWWLSDNSIGSIDQSGRFLPKREGETMVYFQQSDKATADSCSIIVVSLNDVILEMEGNSNISSEETSCFIDERIYITAQSIDNSEQNRYQYDTYTWYTSNPEIGDIDNGLFTAKQVGETMLYAYSNTDAELFDSILVRVMPAARLALKANPYILPYYADKDGIIAKTDLIKLQNSESTISTQLDNIESLTPGLELRLDGNQVQYHIGEFGDYQVRIYAHIPVFAGSDTVMTCTIHYGPDNLAMGECDVYIHNNHLMRRTTSAPITEESICTLDNGETMLAIDGAYAYVASSNTLTRINLTTGKVVASVDCDVKAFLVKANMVIVRGKNQITLLHKTDLTPVKSFALSNPIINIETLTTATIEDTYCINTASFTMQNTIRVAAIPNNEAPKFKVEAPQSVTVNEGSNLTTNVTYTRNTKLSDKEGLNRVKVYIRNLQECQHLITYKPGSYDQSGANFRFVAGYNGSVDQDTSFYIDLEVIDEWGASATAPQIKINIRNTDLSTDVPSVDTQYPLFDIRKFFLNGKIHILRDGIYYDILGNKITDIQ